MSPRSSDTDAFWQAFRRYAGLDHDNYVVGSFGDSPEMATELAGLVIAGIKRATASLVHDYGAGREPIPKPGDFVMMLDGEGKPTSNAIPTAAWAKGSSLENCPRGHSTDPRRTWRQIKDGRIASRVQLRPIAVNRPLSDR